MKNNFFPKSRRGNLLAENLIFIILNLVFLSILILFLVKQGGGAIVLEESYAKNIAMLIDSAKPVMTLKLDMGEAWKLAEKNGIAFEEVVIITGNQVKVKLTDKGGYTYNFFNDVDVEAYLDKVGGEYNGMYVFTINSK